MEVCCKMKGRVEKSKQDYKTRSSNLATKIQAESTVTQTSGYLPLAFFFKRNNGFQIWAEFDAQKAKRIKSKICLTNKTRLEVIVGSV